MTCYRVQGSRSVLENPYLRSDLYVFACWVIFQLRFYQNVIRNCPLKRDALYFYTLINHPLLRISLGSRSTKWKSRPPSLLGTPTTKWRTKKKARKFLPPSLYYILSYSLECSTEMGVNINQYISCQYISFMYSDPNSPVLSLGSLHLVVGVPSGVKSLKS